MNSKPSKSARKRETLALQNLGEQLIDLTAEQLTSIGLEDKMLDAILAAKNMRAHGALRRQKQLIGKLMRDTDPAPITAALAAFGSNARQEKDLFRQAEEWRERLTHGSGPALNEFFLSVGKQNAALVTAVQRWQKATSDDARRLAKRGIFREVHRTLLQRSNTEDVE